MNFYAIHYMAINGGEIRRGCTLILARGEDEAVGFAFRETREQCPPEDGWRPCDPLVVGASEEQIDKFVEYHREPPSAEISTHAQD